MPINHPALLKAENEKLREALRWYEEKVAECRKIGSLGDNARQALDRDGGFRARDALSQQAEPTDTYTAVDMATAAAQGFRDGQAAMEPAPAKDEREAKAWPALAGIGRDSGHPRAVVLYLRHEPSDEHLRMIQEALRTRPAQTEQQPAYVECRECTDCGHVGINDAHQTDATCAMCDWSGPSPVEDQCPDCGNENVMGAACPKCSGRYRILAETHVAAPIAQTEQQPVATVKYGGYTAGNHLVWERGAALPQLRAVAYLDIGSGGYIDLGSDLTNEQLEALPWGRHMLGIIGTHGAEGYVPAAPIAQTTPQPEQSALVEALKAMLETYGPPAAVADKCTYPVDHPITKARAALSAPIAQTSLPTQGAVEQ